MPSFVVSSKSPVLKWARSLAKIASLIAVSKPDTLLQLPSIQIPAADATCAQRKHAIITTLAIEMNMLLAQDQTLVSGRVCVAYDGVKNKAKLCGSNRIRFRDPRGGKVWPCTIRMTARPGPSELC